MTLDRIEYDQYLGTHLRLLYFVGRRENIFSDKTTFEDFLSFDFMQKFRCREAFYKNIQLLDEYIRECKGKLTEADLQILDNFHRYIQGDFVLLKCLRKHAIFINTSSNTVYAVNALADTFQELFDTIPAVCETTLVSYGDKIIYDGFIQKYDIILGPGLKKSLAGVYREAKAKHTIVTQIT